ncbi:NUDIX domain-containing protein, partial [Patescibacteria group bacterium]|nr:NUDIX domain-containing protein [Patescibacteria group bacterium]
MPHIHEKIDFTVTVYVVNESAVLLRVHDKFKFWLGAGGHIELDEDPNQAAIREVKEEVGLDVRLIGKMPDVAESEGYRNLIPPSFMNIHSINDTHQHCDLIYFAESDTRNVVQGETEISDEIRWFTKEELMDPAFECKE